MEALTPDELRQAARDFRACPSQNRATRTMLEHRLIAIYADLTRNRIPRGEAYLAEHPDDEDAADFLHELRLRRQDIWEILWQDSPGRSYRAEEIEHGGQRVGTFIPGGWGRGVRPVDATGVERVEEAA